MPKTATATETEWVEALETCVAILDARNPKWRKVIVRDNKTQQLVEVSLQGEEPPIDPGDEGRATVMRKGELFRQDEEIVQRSPHLFRPTTRTP